LETSIDALLPLYSREREAGRALVLAVLRATRGSTYRKAGALLLIAENGDFAGLLTGGCLEADLREHSAQVLRTGVIARVTYDLTDRDSVLWGIGAGCEGALDIDLMRVGPEEGWQPLLALAAAHAAHEPAHAVLSSGATIILQLPPRVLLCGGGPDALPIAALVAPLHWRLTVVDHRPVYAQAARFHSSVVVKTVETADLERCLDLTAFDAAVVLSHHLESDRRYLHALARSEVGYVGLLGPAQRRDRLLGELGVDAERLRPRLHAPVGLPIGGRGPESIALSIVAELHAYFHGAPAHRESLV
jgi:xanthine dehydrogenase accessory factor